MTHCYHYPMRTWCALVLLAMSSAQWVAHACLAALVDDPSQLRLPAGTTRSKLDTNLRVYGLPLRVETFQSPADLPTLVEMIARQPGAPPSLLVQEGALLLTWQSGPHHWVVHLMSQASHTHGTVSVLTLSDDNRLLVNHDTLPVWLPAHARLLFTLDDAGGAGISKPLRHSVYTHDSPPSRLWPLMRERLRLAGWWPEFGQHDTGGARHYTRGSHRLTLLVVAASGGSGVLAFETWE